MVDDTMHRIIETKDTMLFPGMVPSGSWTASRIAALLTRRIYDGDLRRGEVLPSERVLAQNFGVARGTVRKALEEVGQHHLLERRRGSGTYVAGDEGIDPAIFHETTPLALMDVRLALEPAIIRLAVLNATPRDIANLDNLVATMMRQDPDDRGRFSYYDEVFHAHLAKMARNSLMIWLMGCIHKIRGNQQWGRMKAITLTSEQIRQYNTDHAAIFAAIRDHDADAGAAIMTAHLRRARDSLF